MAKTLEFRTQYFQRACGIVGIFNKLKAKMGKVLGIL